MTTSDPLDLAPIRARLAALPERQWTRVPPQPDFCAETGEHIGWIDSCGVLCSTDTEDSDGVPYDGDFEAPTPADAEFIAHSPSDIAALIAEVERLRGGVAKLRNACHIGSRANPDRRVRLVLAEMVSDLDAVLGGAR